MYLIWIGKKKEIEFFVSTIVGTVFALFAEIVYLFCCHSESNKMWNKTDNKIVIAGFIISFILYNLRIKFIKIRQK